MKLAPSSITIRLRSRRTVDKIVVALFVLTVTAGALTSCISTDERSVFMGRRPEAGLPSFTGSDLDCNADGASCADAALTEYCPATSCPTPYATCEGSRFPCDVDLRRDPQHCGACSAACGVGAANARFDCVEGRCIMQCDVNSADCNGILEDGCEVTFGGNENCDSCGDRCEDPTKPCVYDEATERGQCGCAAGLTFCDKCVDLNTSDSNCAACGTICDPTGGGREPPPNAYFGCLGGECGHMKCAANWANCDDDLSNGCEAYLLSTDSCGACANTCDPGQACIKNTEGFGECMCPPGKTLCENECVDLVTNPWNCGGCGVWCTLVGVNQNGVGLCSYGACSYTCSHNWGDCNADVWDGCEASLGSDPKNCGSCGHTCEVGQPCIAGRCAIEPCNGAGSTQ